MKAKYLFLNILFLLSVFGNANAGKLMLNAKLDSTTMLMGTINKLHLEIVQDEGIKGNFPLFKNILEIGYATLLNDTIELGSDIKIDTTSIGSGRIQINYQVPVQVFDSGTYKLPEFVFVSGRDSAFSKSLMLNVVPVKVTANDKISPMTEVAEPEDKSIFDNLPDWLYYYWWIILLALALIGVGIWLFFRYKKEGTILPSKPQVPPHILALERLQRLKNKNLWQTGQEKEFYTILTDILRSYLDARFGIKAMEMTSRQIMAKLAEDSTLKANRARMSQILDMADFVKFAMVRPLPDDNVKAFENAVAFVESTIPVEADESGADIANKKSVTTDSANMSLDDSGKEKTTVSEKHKLKISDKKRNKRKGGES